MRDRNGNEAVRYTKEVDEIRTPRQGGHLHSSTESSFYFPSANFLRLHITTVLELTFKGKKKKQ